MKKMVLLLKNYAARLATNSLETNHGSNLLAILYRYSIAQFASSLALSAIRPIDILTLRTDTCGALYESIADGKLHLLNTIYLLALPSVLAIIWRSISDSNRKRLIRLVPNFMLALILVSSLVSAAIEVLRMLSCTKVVAEAVSYEWIDSFRLPGLDPRNALIAVGVGLYAAILLAFERMAERRSPQSTR